MTRLPEALVNIEATVRTVARDSARVFVTDHAQDRMSERGITLTQALKCLRCGEFVEGPVLDSDKQLGWKSTQRTLGAGVWIEVVSKLIEQGDGYLIVITAYHRGSR